MNTISLADILQRDNITAALNKHISDFICFMERQELEIISPHLDIMNGDCHCYHYRPLTYFYNVGFSHNERKYIVKRIRKSDDDFVIVSYDKHGILVQYKMFNNQICDRIIPYEYDKEYLRKYSNEMFAETVSRLKYCEKVKAKYLAERQEKQDTEKRIKSEHKYKQYTYYWRECGQCCSGMISVGTGKYKFDDYYDRTIEVMEDILCPHCKGALGLLVVKNGSNEKVIPCGQWRFERDENDLTALMAGI